MSNAIGACSTPVRKTSRSKRWTPCADYLLSGETDKSVDRNKGAISFLAASLVVLAAPMMLRELRPH